MSHVTLGMAWLYHTIATCIVQKLDDEANSPTFWISSTARALMVEFVNDLDAVVFAAPEDLAMLHVYILRAGGFQIPDMPRLAPTQPFVDAPPGTASHPAASESFISLEERCIRNENTMIASFWDVEHIDCPELGLYSAENEEGTTLGFAHNADACALLSTRASFHRLGREEGREEWREEGREYRAPDHQWRSHARMR